MTEHRFPLTHQENGRVVEVRGGMAIVEMGGPPGEAGKRPHCSGCGLCSSAGGGNPELRALVPGEIRVEKGDRVRVELRLARPGTAALLLLGLPLFAFLAASLGVYYAVGSEESVRLGGLTVPLAAVAGFGAMAAAFAVLAMVDRARGPRARIMRKL